MYELLYYPDPLLLKPAKPVTEVTKEIKDLLDFMASQLYELNAIGLGAVQFGIPYDLVVYDLDWAEKDEKKPTKLINPKIIEASAETQSLDEATVSMPGVSALITRPNRIIVEYWDEQGTVQNLTAEGLLSACLQHEIDHNKGKLFLAHLSKLKRDMVITKYFKQIRRQNEA